MKQQYSLKGARNVFAAAVSAAALLALFVLSYEARLTFPDVREYERSIVTLDRHGDILNVQLSGDDEWCIPVSLDKMGAWTALVAVQLEDKRFYEHRGVDLVAICRSFFYNLKSGKVVSGASTITTQLIRIADPQPRTYAAKFSEFWRAMRLESKMSKSEILELYLNRAPFGGNIRGIEAASRIYFDKSAQFLSLSESALLISILRAPSRYRPDRHAEEATALRDRSLALLHEREQITEAAFEIAHSEVPNSRRYFLPKHAAMACAHAANAKPTTRVRSTISSPLQRMLEKNMERALTVYPLQITGAAIIADNTSGEVLAYVGNGRLGTGLPGSEVDCGDAMRSPGSTLKPFIYAAAFERGLLTPASLLADTPLAFHGSAPRNFDLSYRGPVSARTALASSLNAPAVRVLRRLGYAQAIEVLRRFGFANIERESGYYRDALVLGGCEVTLVELASAYRTLAQGGIYTPLTWTLDPEKPKRIAISQAASYLTLDILEDTGRLIPLYRDVFAEEKRKVAFKTGTSHGLRDAWCVGVAGTYTVAVWLGVPEGKGSERLVGLQTAAPIVMQIFRELPNPQSASFEIPKEVFERTVCAISGMLLTRNCLQLTRDIAIRDVSSLALCDMHQNIEGKIVTIWPPEIASWSRNRSENISPLSSIKITKPLPRSRYRLEMGKEHLSIYLAAEGPLPHHWFLDGKFLSTDRNGSGIYIDVPRGHHLVSVLSGEQTDRTSFEVLDVSRQKKDTPIMGVLD
ncbi:penicillin-binding protein 1C [Synergistaceae bacterium OttesenSCG-928-I11]|nr:penicillin-binding protein 1C [Synergistaceae bacterium OttesenSCG-928-I11]